MVSLHGDHQMQAVALETATMRSSLEGRALKFVIYPTNPLLPIYPSGRDTQAPATQSIPEHKVLEGLTTEVVAKFSRRTLDQTLQTTYQG